MSRSLKGKELYGLMEYVTKYTVILQNVQNMQKIELTFTACNKASFPYFTTPSTWTYKKMM